MIHFVPNLNYVLDICLGVLIYLCTEHKSHNLPLANARNILTFAKHRNSPIITRSV